MTVTDNRSVVYAAMADRLARDPVSEDQGRATVPMGRGFALWRRFNFGAELVSVHDDKGREWFLTPKQAAVYDLARTHIDHGTTRIRHMATELGFSPSTVSRALWKLQAIGLIAFIVGRGRYAGLLIIGRVKDDGLERFRTAAKAKLREWRKAAEARVLRLKINVATCYSWSDVEAHGYGNVYVDVMDATLKREWSVQELREAGII
jgi:DNA-binding transcriptional regulator YhcF (GntR family)